MAALEEHLCFRCTYFCSCESKPSKGEKCQGCRICHRQDELVAEETISRIVAEDKKENPYYLSTACESASHAMCDDDDCECVCGHEFNVWYGM